jgi:hypothetical protein
VKQVVLSVLVVLAAVAAGCSGKTGAPAAGPQADSAGPTAPADATHAIALRYAAAPVPRTTLDKDGSFQPSDACLPAGCPAEDAGAQRTWYQLVDLTPILPMGIPVAFTVNMTYAADPTTGLLQFPNVQLYSSGSDVRVERRSAENGFAQTRGELTHFGPEPTQVILVYVMPTTPVNYHLHAEITPQVDRLPALAPAGVVLKAGPSRLHAMGASGEKPALHVLDPSDRLVGDFPLGGDNVTVTLPAASPAGEYIVTLHGTTAPVQLAVDVGNLTSAVLKPIDVHPALAAARDVAPHGDTTWTFVANSLPYRVGLVIGRIDKTLSDSGSTLQVKAPDGSVVVQQDYACATCVRTYSSFGSARFDPKVTIGTYTATVSATGSANQQVREFVAYYKRL